MKISSISFTVLLLLNFIVLNAQLVSVTRYNHLQGLVHACGVLRYKMRVDEMLAGFLL